MKLTKRFYFPDGDFAKPQELERAKSDTGWIAICQDDAGWGGFRILPDVFVTIYPSFFEDDKPVRPEEPEALTEIEKISNYSIEGMQPEVADAFENFEETVEELRKAVNLLIKQNKK